MPDEILKKENIRTMKKDIVRLERGEEPSRKMSLVDLGLAEKKREEREGEEEKKEKGAEVERVEKVEEEEEEEEKEEMIRKVEEKERAREKEGKVEEKGEQVGVTEIERKEKEEEIRMPEERQEKEGWRKRKEEKWREEERKIKYEEERKRETLIIEEIKRKAQELAKREKLLEGERLEKEKEKTRREILFREKENIEEEKNKIKASLRQLYERKNPLDRQKILLLEKIKEIEKGFKFIAEKEKIIEEKARSIEEKEVAAVIPAEEKRIAQERWEIEQKRRNLEEKRWPWDEKLIRLDEQVRTVDIASQMVEIEEDGLMARQKELLKKEECIQAELEKLDLQDELKKLEQLRNIIKTQKDEISVNLGQLNENLRIILEKEREINREKKLVEEEERRAERLEDRRRFEKERWDKEEKRRKIEEIRWKIEEEKQENERQFKRVETRSQIISERINEIIGKIAIIDQKLGIGVKEPEIKKEKDLAEILEKRKFEEKKGKVIEEAGISISEEVKKEEKKKSEDEIRFEEAKKRIEVLKKETEVRKMKEEERKQKERGEPTEEGEEAKEITAQEQRRKEFLKRIQASGEISFPKEGVRSFELPIEPIEKEKEIKKVVPSATPLPPPPLPLKTPPTVPPPPSKPPKPIPPEKPSTEIIRIIPKKPTFREKLWVRVLFVSIVLVLLAGVLTFWYWFLVIRKQPPVTPPQQPATEGPRISDGPPTESGIAVPSSLIPTEKVKTLTIISSEDIRPLVIKVLQEQQNLPEEQRIKDQFTRLIIRNQNENKILGLKEFFEALTIKVPEDFYKKIGNDFTLFIYSQKEGNRLGFVAKVTKKEGLADLLKAQELTMEDDYKNFFSLMGKEEPAIIPYFRDASVSKEYKGPNFRYKTLVSIDLGICYLLLDDYFVFTSSWQSMEKVINRLSTEHPTEEPATKKLTADLQLNNRGDEVILLQTWLAKDAEVYPERIISGFFGQLTQKAVIRFQEKYASEILTPQGLTKGTGTVDNLTRNKLNSLYGKLPL